MNATIGTYVQVSASRISGSCDGCTYTRQSILHRARRAMVHIQSLQGYTKVCSRSTGLWNGTYRRHCLSRSRALGKVRLRQLGATFSYSCNLHSPKSKSRNMDSVSSPERISSSQRSDLKPRAKAAGDGDSGTMGMTVLDLCILRVFEFVSLGHLCLTISNPSLRMQCRPASRFG